jgi:hypothetical protein
MLYIECVNKSAMAEEDSILSTQRETYSFPPLSLVVEVGEEFSVIDT